MGNGCPGNGVTGVLMKCGPGLGIAGMLGILDNG